MRPCWKDAGITDKGASIADWEVERMMNIVRHCDGDRGLVKAIMAEALFRVLDLPKRSAEFRERYYRDNGPAKAGGVR